jgi:hypothetical protein
MFEINFYEDNPRGLFEKNKNFTVALTLLKYPVNHEIGNVLKQV